MCLIHDFGEALTGDIPAFLKTDADEVEEANAVERLLSLLPDAERKELSDLFFEMAERKTPEAKLCKALDNAEGVLSHNEADISTWIEREYTENLVYGAENCTWSDWTRVLREMLRRDSEEKIKREGLITENVWKKQSK